MAPAVPASAGVRIADKGAVLMAVQTGEGAVVTDFTTAGTARLWTNDALIDGGTGKNEQGGTSMTSEQDHESSRYEIVLPKEGRLIVKATPESVEFLLRSNWGPFSSGTFTLSNQVNEWFTLLYLESVIDGDSQKAFRLVDTFFHRVTILAADHAEVLLDVEYASRSRLIGANSGLTLPTLAPNSAAPADLNVFAVDDVEFVRDPAGDNVKIRNSSIGARFDQQAAIDDAMTRDDAVVHKMGDELVSIAFSGQATAESVKMLEDAAANSKQTFRTTLTAPSPASTLTLEMNNMDFDVEGLGHVGLDSRELVGTGVATLLGSAFVDIMLT